MYHYVNIAFFLYWKQGMITVQQAAVDRLEYAPTLAQRGLYGGFQTCITLSQALRIPAAVMIPTTQSTGPRSAQQRVSFDSDETNAMFVFACCKTMLAEHC